MYSWKLADCTESIKACKGNQQPDQMKQENSPSCNQNQEIAHEAVGGEVEAKIHSEGNVLIVS